MYNAPFRLACVRLAPAPPPEVSQKDGGKKIVISLKIEPKNRVNSRPSPAPPRRPSAREKFSEFPRRFDQTWPRDLSPAIFPRIFGGPSYSRAINRRISLSTAFEPPPPFIPPYSRELHSQFSKLQAHRRRSLARYLSSAFPSLPPFLLLSYCCQSPFPLFLKEIIPRAAIMHFPLSSLNFSALNATICACDGK